MGAPLAGLRVVECSMLGPAAITSALVDLGAEVIKVEPPAGDYIRDMTWPIVEGVSLMHLHVNRGKRSVTLDLRTARASGCSATWRGRADVVVEAMRPGALERLGLGPSRLRQVNPQLVFASISGYGATGPYKDYPSHGIAYDTWAGIITPGSRRRRLHLHPRARQHRHLCRPAVWRARHPRRHHPGPRNRRRRGPRARAVRLRRRLRLVSQRDLAGLRAPGVGGHRQRLGQLRAARARHGGDARGRSLPDLRDAATATCCSWPASRRSGRTSATASTGRTCSSAGQARRTPTTHVGNRELQAELRDDLRDPTAAEWVEFGGQVNTPIAPVNTPKTLPADPQFAGPLRLAAGRRARRRPARLPGEVHRRRAAAPAHAPTPGQHTDEVLRAVCHYDDDTMQALRDAGAFG